MNSTDTQLFVVAAISFSNVVISLLQRPQRKWLAMLKWISVALSIIALLTLAFVFIVEHYVR